MSASIVREYNFSVRLSDKESAELEQLAERLGTDKSDAVRRAVRLALARLQPLPNRGCFVPVGNSGFTLPVRLSRKVTDEY